MVGVSTENGMIVSGTKIAIVGFRIMEKKGRHLLTLEQQGFQKCPVSTECIHWWGGGENGGFNSGVKQI